MALKKCKECEGKLSSSAKKCPHCGQNQQSWVMRHKIASVILGFFIFTAIGVFSDDNTATKKPEYSNTPQEKSVKSQDEAPAKKETWTTVKSWKGSGMKKTEAFNITGKQWRINWINNPGDTFGPEVGGSVQIYVERPGSDFPIEVITSSTEKESNTSYVYKTGEFNLNITSMNSNWTIEVEELK